MSDPVTAAASGTGNLTNKYSGGNPIVRTLTERFLQRVDSIIPDETHTWTAADIGTGEGIVAERLAPRFRHLIGVDLPASHLREQWLHRSADFVEADAHSLPFPTSSIDVVFCLEVLEHVVDPERAIRELARVARRALIVSVPREPLFRLSNLAAGRYVRSGGNTPGHINHWSRAAFTRAVAPHAVITQVESPYPWTLVLATPPRTTP